MGLMLSSLIRWESEKKIDLVMLQVACYFISYCCWFIERIVCFGLVWVFVATEKAWVKKISKKKETKQVGFMKGKRAGS